ncbi:MAG: hypothetical protein ACOC9P_01075 [bacterium]
MTPAANNEPAPGSDWTAEEVALVVADYLDMLIAEMRGQRYSKAEWRAAAGSLSYRRSVTGALTARALAFFTFWRCSHI